MSKCISLVIVESPSKCKKIEQYLGSCYKCLASYGHIRELPSLQNIDIENNFNPTYLIINNDIKKKNIDNLKKAIKSAAEIILATDADREGEAIAWHLCEVFKLDITKTKRIIFHEITEKALKYAIENPRRIDLNLVNSQKTRQILDLLVGFKITPILWKFIAKNKDYKLSAGRCQIPALKLIYDNQNDIDNSTELKVYNTTGYFTNSNLPFLLNKQIDNEDFMINFLNESIHFSHIYTFSKPSNIFINPPEPFTTSLIQQVASNELHYSPKETMRICQSLYEDGYITYMRTDCKSYCPEFINSVFNYIIKNYNNDYFNLLLLNKDNKDKIKKDNFIQEAHEAIRPTDILLNDLPDNKDKKERRLYKLIWKNTLESCMVPASYYSITANISAPNNMQYNYKTDLINFPGWKIVENKFSRDNKEFQYLQTIQFNSIISFKKIISNVNLKGKKLHYTEAKLIQLLEEKGIGRPSTFSSLVDKIQERNYVTKEDIKGKEIICKDFELENGEIFEIETKREFGNEKSKLVIQPIGFIVIEFLEKHFNSLFNYEYTFFMEQALDKISKGDLGLVDLCSSCNNEIDCLVENIKNQNKIEFKIDDKNTYIIGKFGPVVKCMEEKEGVTFKSVKKDLDIKKIIDGEYDLKEIIKNDIPYILLGKYEENDLFLRKGKYGLYATWGDNSKNLKELGNRPIENIKFYEVKDILEKSSNIIRIINSSLSIRKGPKGDYLFYKNIKMKKPNFYDIKEFIIDKEDNYKTCDLNILKSWIKEKYNITIVN